LSRLGGPAPAARAQLEDDAIARRLAAMSPEERVGQLFLVAVFGAGDDPLADAVALVRDRRIGGVVLQKGNNLFANARGRDLPREIAELTARLQAEALGPDDRGVPLFVAVDHEGDGDPLTHLREGFTAVPSQMAVGATWDPLAAEAVGRIVGRELSAVGVNTLLGPVLDVLADPRVDTGGDIGTRAFGGHPYWVARMGESYIRGVHEGGGGRVVTVAKHFPGHGGSDRLPDDEVATVYKSLTELKRIELPPFAAATARGVAAAPGAVMPATTDALMTSHIRYRGFQGNIQDATAPISFDPEGMRALLSLEGYPFEAWRRGGGLIVSDSLGVRAVKRLFDEDLTTFPNRDIARQALVAGNDVLILAQFSQRPSWSGMLETVEDTLAYFVDLYGKDRDFRARVDDAALRVLRRKAALYPEWERRAVAADPDDAERLVGTGEARETVARIARQAVTVMRRSAHPDRGARVVVITENARRGGSHPLACPEELCGLAPERWESLKSLGPTLVEAFILERYGPRGTGLVRPQDVGSLTFCQLEAALSPATLAELSAPGAAGSDPAATGAPPENAPPGEAGAAGSPDAADPSDSPDPRDDTPPPGGGPAPATPDRAEATPGGDGARRSDARRRRRVPRSGGAGGGAGGPRAGRLGRLRHRVAAAGRRVATERVLHRAGGQAVQGPPGRPELRAALLHPCQQLRAARCLDRRLQQDPAVHRGRRRRPVRRPVDGRGPLQPAGDGRGRRVHLGRGAGTG